MKKFLIRFGIFTLAAIATLWVLHKQVPYYYGNHQFALKRQFYFDHQTRYNTLFMGSSRTFRHINPRLFDNIMDSTFKSFNMGAVGTRNPELFYLAEHLINELDSGSVQYLFLELTPLHVILDDPDLVRQNYFLDPREYQYVHNYLKETNNNDNPRQELDLTYLKASLNRNLGVGMLWDYWKPKTPDPADSTWEQTDGFTPLRYLQPGKPHRNFAVKKDVLTEFYDGKKSIIIGQFGLHKEGKFINNTVFTDRLQALIGKGQEKGIHVVFWVFPHGDYRDVYPTRDALPANHVMDLSNPYRYEEFFKANHLYDRGHFNEIGARLFTVKFASAFKQEIIQQGQPEESRETE